MSRLFRLTIIFSLVGAFGALSTPLPLPSSPQFMEALRGRFHSPLGFSLSSGDSEWILTPPPKNNKYIAAQYIAPKTRSGIQAGLTVRVDDLKPMMSLKQYVKKWIKDYPKLGFDVLAAKPVKVNGKQAFLMDIFNSETNKQLRQVVFFKKAQAVILTCRDEREHFLQSVRACNSIIKSFQWQNSEKFQAEPIDQDQFIKSL